MRTYQQSQQQLVPAGMGEFVVVQTPQGPRWMPASALGQLQLQQQQLGQTNPNLISPQGSAPASNPLTTVLVIGGVAVVGWWVWKKYFSPAASADRIAREDPDLYVRHQRLRRSRARLMGEVKRMLREVEGAEGEVLGGAAEGVEEPAAEEE